MRNCKQKLERLPHQPPDRPAQSDRVESQCNCDQRHGNKGHQRDRDHIGEGSVNPSAVEMEQYDRHQRDLDDKTCHQEHESPARNCRQPALFAGGQKCFHALCIVQSDNGYHSRKAHLETWTDQRLRPQQQYQKRCDRDHTKRQSLSTQCECDQDEQCRDTTPHGRDFRSGQQSVTDPCEGAHTRCDNRQAHPQCKRRPERKKLQRKQICRRDDSADVQAADRQQMGEPSIAHRVFVSTGNRTAIPACECRSDRAGSAVKLTPHMARQCALDPGNAAIRSRCLDNFNLANQTARGGKPLKPRRSGEVVPSR